MLSYFTIFALLAAFVGCTPPILPTTPKPLEGQKLTLRCPDAAFADAITPVIKQWEVRTGGKVTLSREAMTPTDDSDIGIIPANSLGEWGEQGLLAPVPEELKGGNAFQWNKLLPVYSERFVEWNGQTLAVPLTGDGFVIVYRSDRFSDPTLKKETEKQLPGGLAAPKTWQEFADLAVFFAQRDKKPSLPPLPADPERFFDLFSRVAASADRRAMGESDAGDKIARDTFSFQYLASTGKPRLAKSFGFQYAAEWLQRLQSANAIPATQPNASDDPVAALVEDRAVMAVLSLDQLARLPREKGTVSAKFGIAALPGSSVYFNQDTGKVVTITDTKAIANYVPYFAGGRLGVVRTRSEQRKAAFDLLGDLGSPARSAEFIATPGLGAGPIRSSHLSSDQQMIWLSYGFDDARTKTLQDAMRLYIGESVKNLTFGLRGPDRAALIPAIAGPLRQLGSGPKPLSANDALNQAEGEWQKVDAKQSEETLKRWRQRALGLN